VYGGLCPNKYLWSPLTVGRDSNVNHLVSPFIVYINLLIAGCLYYYYNISRTVCQVYITRSLVKIMSASCGLSLLLVLLLLYGVGGYDDYVDVSIRKHTVLSYYELSSLANSALMFSAHSSRGKLASFLTLRIARLHFMHSTLTPSGLVS